MYAVPWTLTQVGMSRKQKWRSNPEWSPDDDLTNWEHQSITLTIETLTGTTFEVTVSPTDYISSVKSQIQGIEGLY